MTYDELFEILHRAVTSDWLVNTKKGVYTYSHDLDIRVEREPTAAEDASYVEHWACPSPGSRARKIHYNLYYRSSLVEHFTLIDVDDGAAQLPLPHHGVGLAVSSKHYDLARIVDQEGRLDEYMQRCEVRLVERESEKARP